MPYPVLMLKVWDSSDFAHESSYPICPAMQSVSPMCRDGAPGDRMVCTSTVPIGRDLGSDSALQVV